MGASCQFSGQWQTVLRRGSSMFGGQFCIDWMVRLGLYCLWLHIHTYLYYIISARGKDRDKFET